MLGKTEQVWNVGRFFGRKPRTPTAEEIRECFARTLRTISCNESLEFAGADAQARSRSGLLTKASALPMK